MALGRSLLLVLVVAAVFSGAVAAPPKVVRASAELRSHNVLGADVKLGLLQVDFDQPLYLTLSYGNCDNNTWADCRPDPPADCPPCDYTDSATCSGAYATRAPCPCPVLPRTCSLPILSFNEPLSVALQDADFYPVRLYIGPEHLRRSGGGCKIPFWTLMGETGDPDPYLWTAENYDAQPAVPVDGDNADWNDGRPGSDWIKICPKDPKFKFGTYVFGIKAYASDIGVGSKSTLTLQAVDLPEYNGPAVKPTTCNNATGVGPTSLENYRGCLRDGVRERYVMENAVNYYWTFHLPEEKCYPIYIESELRISIALIEGNNGTFPQAAPRGIPAPPMYTGNGQSGFLTSAAFTFCSTGNTFIYMTHRNGFGYADTFSIYVTTAQDTKYLLPVDSPTMSKLDLWIMLQSSAYAIGPRRTFQCNGNPTSDKRFARQDCFLYWHLVPQVEASPFYPRPPYSILLSQWDTSELPKSAQQPVLGTRYQAAVLLKHQLTPTSSIDGADLTEEEFFNLTLQFTGKFANAAGEAVTDLITKFERRTPECDYAKAKPIFDKAREYMKKMENLTVGIELTNTRIAIDTYTFSAAYQDCRDLLPEKYLGYRAMNVTIKGSTACVTATTDPLFAADPCCNPVISWNSTGCIPRDVIVTRLVPFTNQTAATDANSVISVDSSSLTTCRSANCSRSLFADFAKADLRANDCAAATENQGVFTKNLDRPFRKCRDQWIGADPNIGIPCVHDSDCPGSFCNMFTKNCNYSVTEREDGFLRCMLDSVDVFLLNFIETERGIPPRFTAGDQANFEGWKRAFVTDDCSNGGTFPLPLGLRTANRYDKGTITAPSPSTWFGCYEPYWFCLEETCTMPYICDNFLTGAGGFPRTWNTFPFTNTSCLNMPQCNTLNCRPQEFGPYVTASARRNCTQECLFLPNSTTPRPQQFCGACDDEWSCLDVTEKLPGVVDNSASCAAEAHLCYLANGTILTGLTPAECSAIFSCSEKCWKNGAWSDCTEAECAAISGKCWNDQEAFGRNGSCALPMAAYRNPDCSPTMRAHEMGCISYAANISTCLSIPGAHWYAEAHTPTECINQYGYGCLEVYIPENVNQVGDTIVTLKPSRQVCEDAGGQWVPRMPWVYGRWLSGVSRPLTWTERQVRTGRYVVEPVLNWIDLYASIVQATDYKHSFQTKTETICRYNSLVNSLESIACDCASSDTSGSSSSCFANVDDPATVGNAVVCPRANSFVDATPGTLSFLPESVEASNCVRVFPSLVSALQYENLQSSKLSSFLIDFVEKTRWSFRNLNNALVGQILSDGISLRYETSLFSNSEKAFKSVRFCMGSRPDIELQDPKYTVFDIAEVINSTFRILRTQVTATASDKYPILFCGSVNELKSGAQYFPIARLEDAATSRRSIFNIGEVVLAAFLTTLYGIAVIFSIALTIRMVKVRFHLVHNSVWIFGTISFLRMVYFGLMSASSPAESGAADYILIELPSFLYFTALSLFVVSWVILARTVIRKDLRRQGALRMLAKVVAAVNGAIYLLWIILIIIYETTKQTVQSPCGSRLGTQVDNTTRRAISLTYRIFVGAISLILGLGFIVYGSTIVSRLIASAKVSRASTSNSALKPRSMLIFQLTIICSIGLIVQTIFLVLLVATGFQNNVLTMTFLGFFELLPMLIIMAIFWKSTLVQNIPTQTGASSRVTRTHGFKSGVSGVVSQTSSNTGDTDSWGSPTPRTPRTPRHW